MIEHIEINLLPVEYRVHRKSIEIKREVAYPFIGACVIALALSMLSVGMQNSIRVYRNEIKATQKSIELNKPIQNEIVNASNTSV